MRFLFRVLIIVIMIYGALSVIRGLFAPSLPKHRGGGSAAGGHLVKDPVCGMYIPQETALRARDQFFCSEECLSKFLNSGTDV